MGVKQFGLMAFAAILFVAQFARIFSSKTHMQGQSILLVTSHPDDEVMFFGPTLRHILHGSRQNSVNILCLSSGDSANLGETRIAELGAAVEKLGLPAKNATVIENPALEDSLDVSWDTAVVADYVLKSLQEFDVQTVITFDEDGVSGHANHRSVYEGTLQAALEYATEKEDFSMMTLYSVPLWRKYLFSADGLLSRIISVPGVQYHLINGQTDYHWIREALRAHKSQMVWYRHLWSFFSRYMIVNDLKEVNFGRALKSAEFKDTEKRQKIESALAKPIGTEAVNIQTSVVKPKPTKDRAVTRKKPVLSTAPAQAQVGGAEKQAHKEL